MVNPTGFKNPRNNCFANAALQCLLADRNVNAQIMQSQPNILKNLASSYNNHNSNALDASDLIILLLKLFNDFEYLQSQISITTISKKCKSPDCSFQQF